MMEIKKSFVFVLLLTCGANAYGEEATVRTPSVCEFISQTATKANANISRETVNVDKSAPFVREYLIQKVFWDDSKTGSPKLASSDDVWDGKVEAFYESHVRWAHDAGYLPYRNKWYQVLSRTDNGAGRGAQSSGAYITAVLSESGLACAFENKPNEISIPTYENYRRDEKQGILSCDATIDPKNIILPSVPLPEETWDTLKISIAEEGYDPDWFAFQLYPWSPFLDGEKVPRTNGPVLKVDINNDGFEETLININYSDARSSPCDLKYFDLITDDLKSVKKSGLRNTLLSAQGITYDKDGNIKYTCGLSNELVSADGRIAISSYRRLLRNVLLIEDTQTSKLCTSKFSIEPSVVFDASSPK